MRDKSIFMFIREDVVLIVFEIVLFVFFSVLFKVIKFFCSKILMLIFKKFKIKVSLW